MDNSDVIIIPFHLPWDRSADYQRQTCLALAATHLVIAYFSHDARFMGKQKPLRRLERGKNVIVYQPTYVIPFRRFPFVERLNQLLSILYLSWRYAGGTRRVLVWIFDPVFWFYPWARFGYPRLTSLYDCVDYVWHKDPQLSRTLQAWETSLIGRVRYFFVNSHSLQKLHAAIRQPDAVVPQGFRISEFTKETRPRRVFPHNKPIIGYVGSVDERLDYVLLGVLMKDNPQWRFVLWGPVNAAGKKELRKLRRYKNMVIGKSANKSAIRRVIEQFDVAIIPHDIRQDAVRYSFPMKLFEYFYCGKPVVSSPIEELSRYPAYVRIAQNPKQWRRAIADLLQHPLSRSEQRRRRQLALGNTWERKASVMMGWMTAGKRKIG